MRGGHWTSIVRAQAVEGVSFCGCHSVVLLCSAARSQDLQLYPAILRQGSLAGNNDENLLLIFYSCLRYVVHVSEPYNNMLMYTVSLMCNARILLEQTRFVSLVLLFCRVVCSIIC